MFCRKCGTQHDDNAHKCTGCGELLHGVTPRTIDNHLVLAILVTVLCCLPFGIVGIVYAAQVNAKAQGGDVAGAEVCARKARLWSVWGLGVGLVVYGGYALLVIAAAIAEAGSW